MGCLHNKSDEYDPSRESQDLDMMTIDEDFEQGKLTELLNKWSKIGDLRF